MRYSTSILGDEKGEEPTRETEKSDTDVGRKQGRVGMGDAKTTRVLQAWGKLVNDW